MDNEAISLYKTQLLQVEQALLACPSGKQREDLLTLKTNIEELLSLSDNKDSCESSPSQDDEYRLFLEEMEKEGAVGQKSGQEVQSENYNSPNISEGMKCRAPHKHMWGDVVYHDAMVAGVEVEDGLSEPMVIVLFTHPTHKEMLACPYYYDENCKFTAEKCRFSHGERVPISKIQEYVNPAFEDLVIGSYVLAKQPDNLWYKGRVTDVDGEKYFVRLESNNIDIEVLLEDVYPLNCSESGTSDEEDIDVSNREDVINMSLLITPSTQAIGAWESHTKGIGSKLMLKMGYIVGTGLGKRNDGRVEPVTAMVLPAGKSLDYCMRLQKLSGGEENLSKRRRNFKRRQRKEAEKNCKNYENVKKDDVFDFLNKTFQHKNKNFGDKAHLEEQKQIKQDSSRDLNIKSLKLAKKIHGVEMELEKIGNCMQKYNEVTSDKYVQLKDTFTGRQDELNKCRALAQMISSEQKYRENKKKMTIF